MIAHRLISIAGCGILAVSICGLSASALGLAYPSGAQIAAMLIGAGFGAAAAASAIEARRAATPKSDAVHESAVAESETPNLSEDHP